MALPRVLTEGWRNCRAICLDHRVVRGATRWHRAWTGGHKEEFLGEVIAELILEDELMKPRGPVEQAGRSQSSTGEGWRGNARAWGCESAWHLGDL